MAIIVIAILIVYVLYRIGRAGTGIGVKDIDDLLR